MPDSSNSSRQPAADSRRRTAGSRWRRVLALIGLVAASLLASSAARAGEPTEVEIWHTQSMANRTALQQIVQAFNASRDDIVVKETYIGQYSQLYHKLAPTVRAGRPPALTVAYESMVSSLAKSGAVVAFDDYLLDPEIGLSEADRADIFPVFLQSNRYPEFGDKMLSFPFTKSVLLMYYNLGMLREAGYDGPPQTWDEFIEMCRAVRKLGRQAYALSVDASTVDGMIFSFGGYPLDERTSQPQFNTAATVAAFGVIETLITEGLAYRIPHGTYDDRNDVGQGRTAFFIRSSTSVPYLAQVVAESGSGVDWDATVLPHGPGCQPATVLFGANICMFKTRPEIQRAAWEFVKYFVSTEVTAKWALSTGYLPVRRSAVQRPELQAFYAQARQHRRALDVLPFARREPNLAGWQDVRRPIEAAESAVVQGRMTARQAAAYLQDQAENVFDDVGGPARAQPTAPGFLCGLGVIAAALAAVGYLFARGKGRL